MCDKISESEDKEKSTKFSIFSIDSLLSKTNISNEPASETPNLFSSVDNFSSVEIKNHFGKYFNGQIQDYCNISGNECEKNCDNRRNDFDKVNENVVSTSDDFYHSSTSQEEGK
ncbi:hypothetical protein WA026_005003 [Henosepilachna vigintioctopunctata]|uniref:Uncharacterized protein n=1 Tax=Henosepilachna vigintioctopunctata TaxID=420089 RepID=A0AAW1UKD3_9CUCU